ncbi:Hypothetical Protein RradSPS_0322 [Rubrobacter radiotolerans]|uniref:Uncharacterized protein n=1 Tax=Rubrobacter radiotolerans TaxID=42256 RepID=A0A023X0T5_RUBRA|nr:Hypothetical Protein RradSPS_0322 [Rubrobacter radiotolerans]
MATGRVQMRLFLAGWGLTAVLLAAGFLFGGFGRQRSGSRPALPSGVYSWATGVVVGLAVGTTDWSAPSFVGWWQFWWTVPLLAAYLGLSGALRRDRR